LEGEKEPGIQRGERSIKHCRNEKTGREKKSQPQKCCKGKKRLCKREKPDAGKTLGEKGRCVGEKRKSRVSVGKETGRKKTGGLNKKVK